MDTLTLVIIGIGIFVLVSTFFEIKKQNKNIQDLVKLHKCKEYAYYKKPMMILGFIIIPCLICTFIGFNKQNETLLNLGILLSFLFLSETIRSYFICRIYYNDKGVITNDQFLRIKSIKTYYQNNKLPFSKWTFMTFKQEKLITVSKIGKFIIDNYADELPKVK